MNFPGKSAGLLQPTASSKSRSSSEISRFAFRRIRILLGAYSVSITHPTTLILPLERHSMEIRRWLLHPPEGLRAATVAASASLTFQRINTLLTFM